MLGRFAWTYFIQCDCVKSIDSSYRFEWPFENYQVKYSDGKKRDQDICDIKGTFLVALTIIKYKTIKVCIIVFI